MSETSWIGVLKAATQPRVKCGSQYPRERKPWPSYTEGALASAKSQKHWELLAQSFEETWGERKIGASRPSDPVEAGAPTRIPVSICLVGEGGNNW
jgi:hypothetical protein